MYLPSVHQALKQLTINRKDNIHIGNIPSLFFCEAMFFMCKSNIECWLFSPPLHASI